MRRNFMAAMLVLLVGAFGLFAADEPKVEGTLVLGERTYKLSQAVAFETKSNDVEQVIILVSDRRIPVDAIKATLKKDEGSADNVSLSQPYLKLTFDKSGRPTYSQGWADNSSFSGSFDKGEIQLDGGRVRGQAALPYDPEKSKIFKKSFDLKFDLPLGLDLPQAARPKPAGPVKPVVTGSYLANKKPAKLAFVSARPREEFNGKPSLVLIFTEKDHTKDPKADFNASFGRYGSALVLSLHEDGGIFGCVVGHEGLKRPGLTALGRVRTSAFEVGDDRVEGEVTTDGEDTAFDETWQADLKFVAAYKPIAKPTTAAPAAKKEADKPAIAKAPATPATKPAAAKPAKPADAKEAASLNVHDLPLPKDATAVEFKSLVEQMTFKSDTAIKPLAEDLVKQLAAQGWKSDGGDLVTAASAILTRKRGEAELTIMVNPDGKGSKVMIFAQGLDWSEKPKEEKKEDK